MGRPDLDNLRFGRDCGVLVLTALVVIVQPETDSFLLLWILAIVGVFSFAGRDLASRAAPASISTNILSLFGFLSIGWLAGFSRSGETRHLYALTLRQPFIS